MPKTVVVNAQRIVDHQASAAALHPSTTAILTPAVVSNIETSAQIQAQLARGQINPDDIRAYKGV